MTLGPLPSSQMAYFMASCIHAPQRGSVYLSSYPLKPAISQVRSRPNIPERVHKVFFSPVALVSEITRPVARLAA